MVKLTYQQKLDALAYRFYQGGTWEPKAGDFYTTSRADLELYQVVSVEKGVVRTRYTEGSDAISEWPEGEFLTAGFGPKRVFVPEWVICATPSSVQGTWFADRALPVMAMPADVESNHVLKLHFRRPVTDDDRKALCDALNMHQAAQAASVAKGGE